MLSHSWSFDFYQRTDIREAQSEGTFRTPSPGFWGKGRSSLICSDVSLLFNERSTRIKQRLLWMSGGRVLVLHRMTEWEGGTAFQKRKKVSCSVWWGPMERNFGEKRWESNWGMLGIQHTHSSSLHIHSACPESCNIMSDVCSHYTCNSSLLACDGVCEGVCA